MNLLRKVKNTIETNKLANSIFDFAANSLIYKKYINNKIKKYILYIKKSKKYNVTIETTNLCNAKCVMCPHTCMKRPLVIMSDETFNLAISRLKEDKIDPLAFILNGFGEPLTDKKIISRINTIHKKFPNSKIKIYSNLSLPNKKTLQSLINSGLNEINVSFNGYNQKNYEDTMKLNYKKSYENLKTLIKLNNHSKHKIIIRISSTLVSTNDQNAKKFIHKWEKLVDSVSVNKAHDYNNSVTEKSKKYQINFDKKNIFPCKNLFNSIVIGVKGNIFLCCLDYDGKYNFGNIHKNKILDIFYSQKFNSIREMHLNKKIAQMPICKNCYTPYKNGTEWLIKDIY